MLKGAKSIFLDAGERFFLVHFLVHCDFFLSIFVFCVFGNSIFEAPWVPGHAKTLSNTPGKIVTWYVERVKRWRHQGAAADLSTSLLSCDDI